MSHAAEQGSPPNLRQAWALGRLELIQRLNREPTDREIAQRISGSGGLRYIGGLADVPTSAARILELWRAL